MPDINLTGDLVSGAIIAIIGFLAMQELSRIIRGILAFFKPPVVAPRTPRSPFQLFLDFVKNVVILALIVYVAMEILLVYNTG
ncbi:MAG: hypothetical protein ABIK79_16730 [Chloroflexota bacterium]